MNTWNGWTEEWDADAMAAFTWEEWSAQFERANDDDSDEAHQQEIQSPTSSLTARELTRLEFVRWRYRRGYFSSADAPGVPNG